MKTKFIPANLKEAILSDYTSRHNKLWLVTSWQFSRDFYIEYKWAGKEFQSRMSFQFEENGPWIEAKSYEEDIAPKLKFGKEKN